MMMRMFFHFGNKVIVLFQSWNVKTVGGLIGTALAWFAISFLYEGIKLLKEYYIVKRQRLHKQARIDQYSPLSMSDDHRTGLRVPRVRTRASDSPFLCIFINLLLQATQLTLGYFMMLVTMSYNVWLFIAIIAGASVGNVVFYEIKLRYFISSTSPNSNVESSDHCF